MVRDVLKYPHTQLHHQEVSQHQQQQQSPNTDAGMMDLSYSSRSDHNHVVDLKRHNPFPMPMPGSLHRDISSSTHVSSSTPSLLDELQMQQESSRQTNYSSGYPQYQQQNQNNIGLFQQDSTSVSRIPEFLPSDSHQLPSTTVDPNVRTQSQESWGHHSQQAPSMQNQYAALPPFSGGQVNTGEQSFMLTNIPNAQSHAHQSPPRDTTQRPSSTFVLPPEHHLHFPQNLEVAAVHQAPIPLAAQIPSTRVNDFISTGGDSSHAINGWEIPTNGSTAEGTWNQQSSHHNASLARSSTPMQQPGFQTQAAPPLSNNPFQQQPTQNQHMATAVSQPSNNDRAVSDDSLMVDNMFAALGTSGRDGDGGLLSALNSVSLGGAALQQGSNWESKITGWAVEESSSSSSFLQHSRLGDYREGER